MNLIDLAHAVQEHANAHYEDGGWDVFVECWTTQEILAYLDERREFGPIDTPEQAIYAASILAECWADRQADARNSAF